MSQTLVQAAEKQVAMTSRTSADWAEPLTDLPPAIQELLDDYGETVHTVEESFRTTFAELERFRDMIRDEEFRLRSEKLEIAENRTQIAQERAAHDAAQRDAEETLRLSKQQLERERSELQLELELTRRRNSELSDELADLKRLHASENEAWHNELRHLRKTLEKQAQLLGQNTEHGPVAAIYPAGTTGVASPGASNAETPHDPALNSVLNQFQNLQKDLVRRRSQSKGNGKSSS